MSKKLLEALRYMGPITPQLEGPSEYQRKKRLVEIARLAAHGSMLHLAILTRMSKENKRDAWVYLPADGKDRLKAMFDAPTDLGGKGDV